MWNIQFRMRRRLTILSSSRQRKPSFHVHSLCQSSFPCFDKYLSNFKHISDSISPLTSSSLSKYGVRRNSLCLNLDHQSLNMNMQRRIFSNDTSTEKSYSIRHSSRLHVSSYPLDQAKDIAWLNEQSNKLISSNDRSEAVSTDVRYRTSIDILSSDHAKAMKAWYSLHLPSEHAVTTMEELLYHFVDIVSKEIDDNEELAESLAPSLVILHNMAIDAWSKSGVLG